MSPPDASGQLPLAQPTATTQAPPDGAEGSPPSVWRRLLDLVFGYDFFISYSWSDGGRYAAALAARLEGDGYQIFLDRKGYASGDDWKKVGAWTLRRTGQLILVGSPLALTSQPVFREVEVFSRTGRRIVPIDFGGSLEFAAGPATLAPYLPAEILRIREPADALTQGVSDEAVAAITRTFTLVRQDTKRMRVFAGAAVLLGLLALAAMWFAYSALRQKAVVDDRFTRLSVANGTRILEQGDVPGALLWFANPLSIHPKDEVVLRQRLAATAATYPQLLQLLPHDSLIRTMQLNADGDRLLTLTEDSSVRVWDPRSGALLMPAKKLPGVSAVAFAADGRTFATLAPKRYSESEAPAAFKEMAGQAGAEPDKADPDKLDAEERAKLPELLWMLAPRMELSLFDATTPALRTTQMLKADEQTRIWSGPGGAFVVSGSISLPMAGATSSVTLIWKPGGSPEIMTIPGREFDHITFSPDGKTILGSAYGGAWQLFTEDGKGISSGRHASTDQGSISATAMSPSGLQLATADSQGKVMLWDARTGKALGKPLEHGRTRIRQLAFSPDGRWLATTTEEKAVSVWDTVTGSAVLRFALSEPGDGVSFDPSGRYLLATGRDASGREGEARVFDVGSGLPVGPKIASVYQANWNPRGRTIFTVGPDRTVKVWDLFGGEAILSLAQQERLITGKLSADGAAIAAPSARGLQLFGIGEFDRADFAAKAEKRSVWDRPNFALNNTTSLMMQTGNNDSAVFDLVGKKPLLKFDHKDGDRWVSVNHVSAVEFSHDGSTVLIAGGDASSNVNSGRILVWNATTGKARCEPLAHKEFISSASFSPDGRLIVSANQDGTAAIWDVASCALRHRLEHGKAVNHAAFDPGGRLVATAGEDGTARVWDAATGQPLGLLPHEDAVRFVAFSPDSKSLLTMSRVPGGKHSVMRVWDAVSYQVTSAPVPVGEVDRHAAGFSPDGRLIVATDGRNGFRVWSAAPLEALTPHLYDGAESAESGERGVPSFIPRTRPLLLSTDNKGAPVLLGIGNGAGAARRVVPWQLPSVKDDQEQVVRYLEVLASRRIDSTGALVRLRPEELQARWERVRTTLSDSGKRARDLLPAWHRREAEECELTREWFCVIWQIARLAELDPAALDAALHLSNARAFAELERWSEAEQAFGRARASGASDAETVPHIARLRAAAGHAAGQQELVATLVELARGADRPQRTELLHAALIGPSPIAARELDAMRELAGADLRSTEHAHERADARDVLAAVHYRSGRIDDALNELKALKSENYLRKSSVLLLAMAQWRAGDRAAAAESFRQAQEMMSEYAGIRRYEDGMHASSLFWYQWVDLNVLKAEAVRLMGER
jgi:WD40 repeat protein